MKKGRIILGAASLVLAIGSAFAFNSHHNRFALGNLYSTSTCSSSTHKVACHTGTGPTDACAVSPVYVVQSGACNAWSGDTQTVENQ